MVGVINEERGALEDEEEEVEEDCAQALFLVGFKVGIRERPLLGTLLAAVMLGSGGKGGMAREMGTETESFCLVGSRPLAFIFDWNRNGISATVAASLC